MIGMWVAGFAPRLLMTLCLGFPVLLDTAIVLQGGAGADIGVGDSGWSLFFTKASSAVWVMSDQ